MSDIILANLIIMFPFSVYWIIRYPRSTLKYLTFGSGVPLFEKICMFVCTWVFLIGGILGLIYVINGGE
jgi:hypothetical protein